MPGAHLLMALMAGSGGGGGGGGGGAASAVASPTTVSGSGAGPVVTTGATTVTITGGVGPFTVAWEDVSNPDGIVATSSTSQSTTFRAIGFPSGFYTAQMQLRCTDTGNGNAVFYSNAVTANITVT